MTKEYNCFSCEGKQENNCITYQPYKNENVCTYKLVADHDLKKHATDDPTITLKTMLEEYLKR